MAKDTFNVTLVYANTGEEATEKVDGDLTAAELLAQAYTLLGKTPQEGDRFEIHDQLADPARTVASYAEEFGKHKKELIFEVTNPTGGA